MDPEMTEMMELAYKDVSHYNYKYLEKNTIVMSRETEDTKKESSRIYRDEKYTI